MLLPMQARPRALRWGGSRYLAGGLLLLAATLSQADERVRAQIVSPNQSALSAEIAAKIVELPFREGDAFKTGDTLA